MSTGASGGRTSRNWYKMGFWVLLVACALLVAPSGCSYLGNRLFLERHEFSRVASPDEAFDAVLVKVQGFEGATGRSSLDLYLVPAGVDASNLSAARRLLTADNMSDLDDLELRWRGERMLEVHYDSATISGFKNLARVGNGREERFVVELRLVPPEDGFGIPEAFLSNRR